MCNEMKGNIFALKFVISYPDMIQYVIHALLLFILFLYWAMLKNIAVAIMRLTGEFTFKAPTAITCPVAEDLINHVKAER